MEIEILNVSRSNDLILAYVREVTVPRKGTYKGLSNVYDVAYDSSEMRMVGTPIAIIGDHRIPMILDQETNSWYIVYPDEVVDLRVQVGEQIHDAGYI